MQKKQSTVAVKVAGLIIIIDDVVEEVIAKKGSTNTTG